MAVADCVKISFEACVRMRFLYWISVFWVSNLGGVYLKGDYFWTFTFVMLHQPLLCALYV